MAEANGSSLSHPGLSRPKPRRIHTPSRARVARDATKDQYLDGFFPTISVGLPGNTGSPRRTLAANDEDSTVNPEFCVDMGERKSSRTSPPLRLVRDEDHVERGTNAEGVVENNIIGKTTHLRENQEQKRGGGTEGRDPKVDKRTNLKTGRKGWRSQVGRAAGVVNHVPEEVESDTINTNGQNVGKLAALLATRVIMYTPVDGGIVKEHCEEEPKDHDNCSSGDGHFTAGEKCPTEDDFSIDDKLITDKTKAIPSNHVATRQHQNEEKALRKRLNEELALRKQMNGETLTLKKSVEEGVILRRPRNEEVELRRPINREIPLNPNINEEFTVVPQDCGSTLGQSFTEDSRADSVTEESSTSNHPGPEGRNTAGISGREESKSATPIASPINGEEDSGKVVAEGGEVGTLRNHKLEVNNSQKLRRTTARKEKKRRVAPPVKPPRTSRLANKTPTAVVVDTSSQLTPGEDKHRRSHSGSQKKGNVMDPLEKIPVSEGTDSTQPSSQDLKKELLDLNHLLATLEEPDDISNQTDNQRSNSVPPDGHNVQGERSKDSSETVDDPKGLHNFKPPIQSPKDKNILGSPISLLKFNKIGSNLKKHTATAPESNLGMKTPMPYNPQKGSALDSIPNKPPRESLYAMSQSSLEKDQDPCGDHGAALNFYCSTCRVVICRDCTVVAHQQQGSHRVLDTPDALATLRTETVTLLRHYTLLKSLHDMITQIYHKYTGHMIQDCANEVISTQLRLKDRVFLAEIVKEAEKVVATGRNLRIIKDRVREWEEHQHDWDDLIFLSLRCTLLANFTATTDKVYLRMGDWVMPTPWVHLSHLLQPCLGEIPPPSRDALQASPSLQIRRPSFGKGTPCGGATDPPFPHNARHVVLSNLVPYIIFNPNVRYFIQISDHQDLDVTMIVVPAEDHIKKYIMRNRHAATASPRALRRNGFAPSDDSFTLVEKQMMMGGKHRTRLIASYITSNTSGTTTGQSVVKVNFPDVKIVADGHGLPSATGGVKRGDVVVDHDSNGLPSLCVAIRDVGEVPALRLGYVTLGLDGLTCLVEAEDTKRTENTGFRKKILASVRREEEAIYQVTFGMDL